MAVGSRAWSSLRRGWRQFRFVLVDGWRSRGEGRRLGAEHARALRDASHTTGSRSGSAFSSSAKASAMAIEAEQRYRASFVNDRTALTARPPQHWSSADAIDANDEPA